MERHVLIDEGKLYSEFAERLYNALDSRDLKMADLYNDGIVSKNCVYRYMSGQGGPTFIIFRQICEYLNVSGDYLLGLSSIMDFRNHWLKRGSDYYCPECGAVGDPHYHFCPMCGEQINTDILEESLNGMYARIPGTKT